MVPNNKDIITCPWGHERRYNAYANYFRSIYLSILKADLLVAKGKIQQSEEVFAKIIGVCEAMHYWYELVNCRSRYGMSLAKRGIRERAREQFDEAMNVAKRIGCEKRVQLFAKRVGIVVDVQ